MKTVKTIGINSNQPVGRGFNFPYDIAINDDLGKSRIIYLLNRPNSATRLGTRIQYFTFEEEWIGEFGNPLDDDEAKFTRPVTLDFNSKNQLHVTDEATDEIKIFDSDGNFQRFIKLDSDSHRNADQFGPAGIAIDSDDFIYVASRYLNVIQKLTSEGRVVTEWGGAGSGPGEFEMPWGMDVDAQGNLYVADWRNDRIQKFDSEGNLLHIFGESGVAIGQFNRPSSVAVDTNMNIAVADWGNERVQILDEGGSVLNVLEGDATLSKWSHEWLDVNLDEREARNRADLKVLDHPEHLKNAYHEASQTEHKFWGPVSVKFDSDNQLYVTEHSRHRIQVFEPVNLK